MWTKKEIFAHYDFPKVSVLRTCSRNAIGLFRMCIPGNIYYLRRKKKVPMPASGKGQVCGWSLPWIIGMGRGSTEVILRGDTECWHIGDKIFGMRRDCCCNDVSKMNATHQDNKKKGLSGKREKCITLFTQAQTRSHFHNIRSSCVLQG